MWALQQPKNSYKNISEGHTAFVCNSSTTTILEDSAFGELNPLEIPRIRFDVVHPHS